MSLRINTNFTPPMMKMTGDLDESPPLLDNNNNKGTGKCKITISEQVKDQLEALLRQECNYRCVDYITERRQTESTCSNSSSNSIQPLDNTIKQRQSSSAAVGAVGMAQGSINIMPKPTDLVHLLQECAFLVTDTRFVLDQSSSSSPSSSLHSPAAAPTTAFMDISSSSSSSSAPGSPFKRVGSMVSFKGIHEEAAHQQQRQDEQCSSHQHQQQPSGEDLAYWRQQMMDWAYLVVESFEMNREVVAVAFNLLDRFIPLEMSRGVGGDPVVAVGGSSSSNSGDESQNSTTTMPPITRDDYQLYAMTCLYTAVKVWEPYPRKFAVEALVAMSRDFYAAQDIIYTERDILKALQWRVNPPTAMAFGRHFIDTLSSSSSSANATTCTSSAASSDPPSLLLAQSSTTSPSSVRSFVQMEEREYHGGTDQNDLHALCAKITEMAVADPFFLSFNNSTIGLAAVLHAARLSCGGQRYTAASCKALLKALQKSKIMSTTSTTNTPATGGANNSTGEQHVRNQISGSELEVVYTRLEKLLCQ